jgi:transposase InsO family protein
MLDVIEKQYETSTGISKTAAFGIYKGICEEKGITDPASFKTFCSYINNRPLYLALLKREGRKAAYEFEPEYLEVNLTTPRHGERPWECCYLDHTESDIELKDPVTGETYRPYESVLFDGYSRRVLVIHIQKERPNRETCLAIFRKCVERFGRLPNFIVHDGGAEFSSTDVQIFLARYRIGNKKRPASKSRFGSVQERYFGSKDTILIHNLQGNTKLTKNPRKLTPEVNPKNLAVWTLEAFTQLYEEFCYEVYDKAEHSTLCCSPRAMYEEGIRRTGKRKHKDVSPKDPDFLALTLPSPRRRTAKVQPRRGIKVGGDWFKNALFNAPKVVGTRVEVKCVPENAGVILAYVDGRWIECYSKYYALFKGKSRREIAQITKEIKAQKKASGLRAVISAKDIANFLKKAAIMQTFLSGPVVEVKESVDQAASAGEERYQEQASEIPKDSDAGDDLDNNSETDWEDDWADGEVEEV